MFWLIEDTDKIDILCRIRHKNVYVDILPISHTHHAQENEICAIYLKPTQNDKGYILPVNHNDTINLPIELIQEVLDSIETIHVHDKKEFLHYFTHKSIACPVPGIHVKLPTHTPTHEYFYRLYPDRADVNAIIPIVKHYEWFEQRFSVLPETNTTHFYNKACIAYNMLERSGISVNTGEYKRCFGKDDTQRVYTHYNLNTTTTRPSNTFGGINFNTLSKDNGERECFIPNNDTFIELDVSAYHVILLAHLVGHEFDIPDVHHYFANLYNVDYHKAKEITFQQLYGGIWKQYENLVYFSKVKKYTDTLWHQFTTNGYIECPLSQCRFERDKLSDMNPQKLLNYVLQNYETATNVKLMWNIFKLLRGKNTKLVLSVYDSFLFDVDESETETMSQILDVFKQCNLNVKAKAGDTYNFK
jgi:hypothetical protein